MDNVAEAATKETVTLTKASLINLLDAMLYPNPDDSGDPSNPWGPYGPHGPVIRGALRDLDAPQPNPWRSALLARSVIDRVVAQWQMAGAEQMDGATENIRTYLRDVVDDFCGTRPRPWPRPWPWQLTLDSAQLNPVDLLVAGAQFQRAADLQSPMQKDFSSAADRLFEAGLNRLENR
jgi:hypothetical protein